MHLLSRLIAILKAWSALADPDAVPQPVVNRRIQRCLNCPHNTTLPVWKRLLQPANHPLKNRQCNQCGCPLAAKTIMPLSPVRAATPWETFLAFPDHCWIKNPVENDPDPTLPSPP